MFLYVRSNISTNLPRTILAQSKMNKLKIDIVSDVVCPWCTIGYKRLERAINDLNLQNSVELEWHPFELNPYMPKEGQNVHEHITEKYGASMEQQKESQRVMTEAGAELGFKFDYFDEMKIVNTRDAHILLDFAKRFGKQTDLKMRLTAAFFGERQDVSNRQVLAKVLNDVGLDAEEALKTLDDDEKRYQIKSEEAYWQNLGVNSVPIIIFDQKSAVRGAQPVEVFKNILTELTQSAAPQE